jgi:endonuclease/exonuclease/phosphatase family metal-dependent hydrolase
MSAFPARVKVMTYNIWGNHRWPERQPALLRTIRREMPDVLLLQEVSPELLQALDLNMTEFSRVSEPEKMGWTHESNIYYDKNLLLMKDYGSSALDIADHPHRALFWARFELLANPAVSFFASTVHMPWSGSSAEIETGMNQRIPVTKKVIEQLRRVSLHGEPIILAGDFNDDFHPTRILQEEMGCTDVFTLLDMVPPITHPVRCSSLQETHRPDRTLDWITCVLPENSRVVGAYARSWRGVDCASDHLPVVAFFEFGERKL